MKIYKNRYTQSILITLLSVLFISCSDDSVSVKGPHLPNADDITPLQLPTAWDAQDRYNLFSQIIIQQEK
jgi:hypothetical protein